MTFSFTPLMGRTSPLSVSSPVMASGRLIFWLRASESGEVARVMPTLGPSLGVAPSGR
jgi:hypothetical protein